MVSKEFRARKVNFLSLLGEEVKGYRQLCGEPDVKTKGVVLLSV